jgi:hypothetical protein
MNKTITVTVSPYDLKKFLIKEGFMTEDDLISKIHLIVNNEGIIIEITNPQTWSEKQKEFLNAFAKDMKFSPGILKTIKTFYGGTGSRKQQDIFNKVKGSDLFARRKEKEWKQHRNFGSKSVFEFNELLKKYDLPPLEKE